MKAPRIAGYTYKADTYCPGCIVRQLSIIAERGFSDVRDVARLMRRTATLLENTTDFDATVPKFRVYNVADTIDRMIEETGQ